MNKKTRDIGAEILQGIREIKRGEYGRIVCDLRCEQFETLTKEKTERDSYIHRAVDTRSQARFPRWLDR